MKYVASVAGVRLLVLSGFDVHRLASSVTLAVKALASDSRSGVGAVMSRRQCEGGESRHWIPL